MIQIIIIFTLGFLTASLLAFMVAPAIWRRAVALTSKRVAASSPFSRDEIQADKDRIRAEYAMTVRRLEMKVETLKQDTAGKAVEIGRNREDLDQFAEDIAERDARISGLETNVADLDGQLAQANERTSALTLELEEARTVLDDRAAEIRNLEQLYEEASFNASSRQIELVSRDTQLDKLSGDISEARGKRKEIEGQLREANLAAKAANEENRAEKKKSADLENRLETMLTRLTDSEERRERREKDLADAKDAIGQRDTTIANLQHQNEEAGYKANSQQIELAARDAKLDKLSADASEQRQQLKDIEGRLREANAALKSARDEIKAEKKTAADREKQFQKMQARLDASKQDHDRAQTELSHPREQSRSRIDRPEIPAPNPAAPGLAGTGKPKDVDVDDPEAKFGPFIDRIEKKRDDLQARLTKLGRERRQPTNRKASDADDAVDAALRNEIGDLAAEIVYLTALLDGPDGPLKRQLEQEPAASDAPRAAAPNLAGRVRALADADAASFM